jgi:outer membrane receptor protein involved in Fe transport
MRLLDVVASLRIGATVRYYSDRVLDGDESNQLEPIDGYALVSLVGRYPLGRHISIFARVNNVSDKRYASFGELGDADDVLGGRYDSPRFLSSGAPREVLAGVRVSFR